YTPRARLSRHKLDALRTDRAERNGNDGIAPASQVVVFVGEVLTPGIYAPGAIGAFIPNSRPDECVTADLQGPAHSIVAEGSDTVLVEGIGVFIPSRARVRMQHDCARGEGHSIVHRGTQVPTRRELQAIA